MQSWCGRTIGSILLGLACAACASYSDVRFAPALQDTDLRGEADDVQARVTVAWRGIEEREDVPELRFRVRVENPGSTPFTLVPAGFELLDAGLNSFGLAATESLPVAVEAGEATTFDIAFPVPGDPLARFDLSALTLHTRFQGQRWSWNTTFHREERVPSSGPHWSFGFGAVFAH